MFNQSPFFLASLVAIIGFLLFALILETIPWGIWSFPHKIWLSKEKMIGKCTFFSRDKKRVRKIHESSWFYLAKILVFLARIWILFKKKQKNAGTPTWIETFNLTLKAYSYPKLGWTRLFSTKKSMYSRYQNNIWKLVKILLVLIIFYKMNTDNDA